MNLKERGRGGVAIVLMTLPMWVVGLASGRVEGFLVGLIFVPFWFLLILVADGWLNRGDRR
jgi:hypothetical protein